MCPSRRPPYSSPNFPTAVVLNSSLLRNKFALESTLKGMPPSTQLGYVKSKMSSQLSGAPYRILEILNTTQLFEAHGIPCCVVGVSALIHYGVPRVRDIWEICIPTKQMQLAVDILKDQEKYVEVSEERIPQPRSLAHTYPWFRMHHGYYSFRLVPSSHSRIAVEGVEIYRDTNSIPYASLKDLVQSYLDTNDTVSLCDIVDGANLCSAWGEEHLDLNGTTDVDWAEQRNTELTSPKGGQEMALLFSSFPTARSEKRPIWEKAVGDKQERLKHILLPTDMFETRYVLNASAS